MSHVYLSVSSNPINLLTLETNCNPGTSLCSEDEASTANIIIIQFPPDTSCRESQSHHAVSADDVTPPEEVWGVFLFEFGLTWLKTVSNLSGLQRYWSVTTLLHRKAWTGSLYLLFGRHPIAKCFFCFLKRINVSASIFSKKIRWNWSQMFFRWKGKPVCFRLARSTKVCFIL